MTGEMHRSEVTPEAFPLHFAIAKAMHGTVEPFDQYQGPYVMSKRGKFWIQCHFAQCSYGHEHVTGMITVYNDHNGQESDPTYPDAACVVKAARCVASKRKKERL